LFEPSRLERIVAEARRLFALPEAAKITVEANPGDLDRDGYRALRGIGVNRLSLGVQSLDDGVLREMGRVHTSAHSLAAVAQARAAGYVNVSVDLILGWPGESASRWRRNLDGVRAMWPEHVSLYVLEVEGRTVLSHRARRGRLELPDDDLVADLHAQTVDALAEMGLAWYEISNFARAGFESRHNAKYWDDVPFLGFGMSAHSYRDGRRWWNHATFASYCGAVEKGGAVAAMAAERRLGDRERLAEAAFTGLRRRGGLDLAGFRARYGADLLDEYGAALRRPMEAGLLAHEDGRLRLTERGMLLSNEVLQAFVEAGQAWTPSNGARRALRPLPVAHAADVHVHERRAGVVADAAGLPSDRRAVEVGERDARKPDVGCLALHV
jgi:oxygen-independent coproporphyrinogen-3 oxidase